MVVEGRSSSGRSVEDDSAWGTAGDDGDEAGCGLQLKEERKGEGEMKVMVMMMVG